MVQLRDLIHNDLGRLHALFFVVKAYVLSAGGDGDGWVISNNFLGLANRFEEYEKDNDPWFTERIDSEEHVAFIHEQEAIMFVSKKYQLPKWAGDIVISSI